MIPRSPTYKKLEQKFHFGAQNGAQISYTFQLSYFHHLILHLRPLSHSYDPFKLKMTN